jgi:hypothetical protein
VFFDLRRVGVCNLLSCNQVLLGKWPWHYVHEREALRMAFVETKYSRMWGGWCSNVVHENKGWGYGRILGRAGRSFFVILNLRLVMTLELDFGMMCDVEVLKVNFLNLFSLACCKDAFVANHLQFSNYSHQWNVTFSSGSRLGGGFLYLVLQFVVLL